jgi:hypothetical protein
MKPAWAPKPFNSDGQSCVSPEEVARQAAQKAQRAADKDAADRKKAAQTDLAAREIMSSYLTVPSLKAEPPSMSAISSAEIEKSEKRERDEMIQEIMEYGHTIRSHNHDHEPHADGEGIRGIATHEMILRAKGAYYERNEWEEYLRKE